MSQIKSETHADEVRLPWWRERTMWLVVGGPSAVVLACMATLALALLNPDPVLDTAAEAPALKARNHAATGGQ
jgi:hypothetical protein